MKGRLLLLVVIGVAVALFFVTGLHREFSLDQLRAHFQDLHQLDARHPLALAGAYFAVYVLMATLSLPGAAILTLLGGAIFGVVWGSVLVSFASSGGALLSFLTSRYLFKDFVQARYGARFGEINAGLRRDGILFLLTLRLVPVIPYFVVNLLMGLTNMRLAAYYLVSQIGMLPATVILVQIGTQLGAEGQAVGALSWHIVTLLAALAALPWIARRLIRAWQLRRRYARWTRPRRYDRNLVVIGAGAGGLVTSYVAAAVKAKVTLIESHRMGGDCLNYGCVPSKALIKTARVASILRHAERYGLSSTTPPLSFDAVMTRVRQVIDAVAPHDSVERYTALGVEVLEGHALIVDPWTIDVTLHSGKVRRLTTRGLVVATGAAPVVPRITGIEESGYVTSETLWSKLATLPSPPERVVILGGGPIGTELAQALARLGSQVTQIEKGGRLLGREDPEVSASVHAALNADGVNVLLGYEALQCRRDNGIGILIARGALGTREIPYDLLVCAVGRRPRLAGFGLEALGVLEDGKLPINEYLEAALPNILAAGDVTGSYQFTHFAGHQGWYAAVNALFGQWRRFKVDTRVIPRVTFTDPEIARVGLNESDAVAGGVAFETTTYRLEELDRAIAESRTGGFVKVLTAAKSDRILGACIVGDHAGEMLAEFTLAMKHGLGLKKILGTIHPYPTFSEANKYAAGEWQRAHLPTHLLRWVQRYHDWRRD